MPRGVKGSGPYSKYKDQDKTGEVQNDLATSLKDESATEKASASTTKSRAATKRPARKATAKTKTAAAPATNGNGNGNGNGRHVTTVSGIAVSPDGTLSFIGEDGQVQRLQLSTPALLLTLEERVKTATDEYVRDLAASRS